MCISAYNPMSCLPYHYLYISFVYCTCWVPTISVLNLAIFPCYSNLLLRRRRWIVILRRGVLGYMLPQLLFLWFYRVFRYSVSLRVVLVFKDIIYVIIILYIRDIWLSVSTFGHMCGTLVHVFHAYTSVDRLWMACALSQSTTVRFGRIACVSTTHDATQFGDSICPVCAST
jgi:hypothetical protein